MESNEITQQENAEQMELEMEQETILVTEANLIKHIKSKQIRSKLKAVEFVLGNFETLDNESKEAVSETIADFLKESNPALVENSLEVIIKLFEIGKTAFIKPIKTFKYLLEKTMTQSKKSIVEKSEGLVIPLAERIQKEDLIEIFKNMLSNKNPKVQVSCFSTLKILIAEFGIRSLGDLKEIFPLLEKSISSGNNSVKKEGTALYTELWKYMGELMKDEKAKLSKFMQKEIEDGLANWDGELIRGRREQSSKAGGKSKVDIYDLAEEVDIWSKYKEKWAAAVLKKSKWKEKCDDLEALNKDMDVIKLANGPYKPILEMLKRLSEDSNANVQITAVKSMGLMSKGLRHHFKGVISLTKSLISKLKNKKSTMSEEVANTILNFLLVNKLADFSEVFNENFKDKNPVLKINLIDLAKEAIEFKLKQNEKTDCEAFLFKIKANFDFLNKDASKEVREKFAEFMKFVHDSSLSFDHMPEHSVNHTFSENDSSKAGRHSKIELLSKIVPSDNQSDSFHSIHDTKPALPVAPTQPVVKSLLRQDTQQKILPSNLTINISNTHEYNSKNDSTPPVPVKSFLRDPNKITKPALITPKLSTYSNQLASTVFEKTSMRSIIGVDNKASTKQLVLPKFPTSTQNIMLGKSLLPQSQSKQFIPMENIYNQTMNNHLAESYNPKFKREPEFHHSLLSKQSQIHEYYQQDQSHQSSHKFQSTRNVPLSMFSAHQIDESVVIEHADEEMDDEAFWQNKKKDEVLKKLMVKLNAIDGVEETNDLLIKLQRHTNDFKEVENLKIFTLFLERLSQQSNIGLNATSFVVLKNVIVKDLSKPKSSGRLFYQICEKLLLSMGPFRFYAMIFNYIFDKQYVNNSFIIVLIELLIKTPTQLLTDQQVVLLHRAVEFFYTNLPNLSDLSSVIRFIVSERLFELKDEYPELLYVDLSNISKPNGEHLDFPQELYEEFSILKSRGQDEFSKFSRPVLIDEEVLDIIKYHQNNPKQKLHTLEKLYLVLLRYSKFYFVKKDLNDKLQTLLADCLNGNEANKQALKFLSIIWFLYSHANGFELFMISKKFITMFTVIMLREKSDHIRLNFARTLQRHLIFDSVKNIPSFFKLLEEKSPELKLSLLFILSERFDQMKESEIISMDKAKIFLPLFGLLKEKKKEVKEKAEEFLEFLLTFFPEKEIVKLIAKQTKEIKDFVTKFYSSHNNSQMRLQSFKDSHSPQHGSTINFLQFDAKDYNIYDNKNPISHITSNVNSRVASRENQKRRTVNITIDDNDFENSDLRISHTPLDKPFLLSKSIESTKQLINKLDLGMSSSYIMNSGIEEPPKVIEKKPDITKKQSMRAPNPKVVNRRQSKDYILDDFIRFEVLERLVPYEIMTNLSLMLEEIFSFPIAELIRNTLMDLKGPVSPNFYVICEKMNQQKFIGKRNIKLLFLCLLNLVLSDGSCDEMKKEKILERLSWFTQNLEQNDGAKIKLSNDEFEVFCEIMEHLDFNETQRVLMRDDIVQRVIVENILTEAMLKVLSQIYDQVAYRSWIITTIKQEHELHERRTKIMINQKEGILFCFAFGPENDILDIFIGNDCFHNLVEKEPELCIKGFLILFERFKKTMIYKHFWNEKFMVFILDNCWEFIKEQVENIEKETFLQLIKILIELLFCGLCYSHPKINKLIRNLMKASSKQKLLSCLLYLEFSNEEENNYLQTLLVSEFENLPYPELSELIKQVKFTSGRKLNSFGEYIQRLKEEEEAIKDTDSVLAELKGWIEVYQKEVN